LLRTKNIIPCLYPIVNRMVSVLFSIQKKGIEILSRIKRIILYSFCNKKEGIDHEKT
jgi:hypothetical protein